MIAKWAASRYGAGARSRRFLPPTIDAFIEIVPDMTGKNFAAERRTLDRLGLTVMDVPRIRGVVDEGFDFSQE